MEREWKRPASDARAAGRARKGRCKVEDYNERRAKVNPPSTGGGGYGA